MKRNCAICDKTLEITVNNDKTYSGGHFYGEVADIEFWECDVCHNANIWDDWK